MKKKPEKKYEIGWRVSFSDDEVLGAVLVAGFAEISSKNMVDFIFHNNTQSVPNASIYRNKREALIKMKEYTNTIQKLIDEQLEKE